MKPSRRENRTRTNRVSGPPAPEKQLGLASAARWPVFECLISASWHQPENLTHLLVAKEPPFGGVVCCVFLVDLGCLGPKEGFVTQFRTRAQYETEFRATLMNREPLIPVAYPVVAKIIAESLRYARQLGFEPPPQVSGVLDALGSLNAAAECQQEVPLGGRDGRPCYVAGPDDDVAHIIATLTRTCGNGNFHFTIPTLPIPRDFFA